LNHFTGKDSRSHYEAHCHDHEPRYANTLQTRYNADVGIHNIRLRYK